MQEYMRKFGRDMDSDRHKEDRGSHDGKDPNRRKSVLMELMSNTTCVVNAAPIHVVQEPDITHLYLQDMEPRHVVELIQGAHKVMLESKSHFKIHKQISKEIIATMCVRMEITELKFCFRLRRGGYGSGEAIRPVSVFDFGKLLMENLSCRGTYSRDKYQSLL
jgi:hypothetical protein